jgi:alkylation response protein AidB-like acyl-CoA dehydrogenase
MNFELSESVRELGGLAETIFSDLAGVDRIKHVETELGGHDAKLWAALADAGVLGAVLPEADDGAGLGMLGVITVLEAQGRRVAPVPLWPVLAGAALPIAWFGSTEQKDRWLTGLVGGTTIVTSAAGTPAVAGQRLHATRAGKQIVLSGHLTLVYGATVADAIVVPFTCDGIDVVAVIPTAAPTVTVTPVAVTSRVSAAAVTFHDVQLGPEDLLSVDGADAQQRILGASRVALAGLQAGICSQAVTMAAAYTSERMQFGRPLSTNQAVAVRAADAHLDTVAIRLTAQRAAWLMDRGAHGAATSAALVAKWWAAHGGLRTVHATQHLHGGIGADVDYPIHRYFLWGRDVAFTLGGAPAIASELAGLLPDAPPVGSLVAS